MICDRHQTSVASTEPASPHWPAPHFASTITQLDDYPTHNKPRPRYGGECKTPGATAPLKLRLFTSGFCGSLVADLLQICLRSNLVAAYRVLPQFCDYLMYRSGVTSGHSARFDGSRRTRPDVSLVPIAAVPRSQRCFPLTPITLGRYHISANSRAWVPG